MRMFPLVTVSAVPDESLADRSSDKLQSAIYYGIDGDQVMKANFQVSLSARQ